MFSSDVGEGGHKVNSSPSPNKIEESFRRYAAMVLIYGLDWLGRKVGMGEVEGRGQEAIASYIVAYWLVDILTYKILTFSSDAKLKISAINL